MKHWRPTSGGARVGGLDILKQSAQVRRIIGVALQDAGLDYLATGRELLEVQGRLHGLHGRLVRDRADKMLTLVGLKDAAERRVGTYSGGMRRRLDLASALVHDPEILFLDEPTAGLDPASRQAIWDEVIQMNRKRGITVELDTSLTRDSIPVVIHDLLLDHTTTGSGLVRDLDLKAIKALDAGSHFFPQFKGEQIPTLDEVFLRLTGSRLEGATEEVAS